MVGQQPASETPFAKKIRKLRLGPRRNMGTELKPALPSVEDGELEMLKLKSAFCAYCSKRRSPTLSRALSSLICFRADRYAVCAAKRSAAICSRDAPILISTYQHAFTEGRDGRDTDCRS